MAENIPNPAPGAPGVPPKKAETGKVQPKKETVRISLPPKPTSAPTIKLPTLPAGGPPPPAAPPPPPAAAAAPGAAPGSRAPAPPAPPAAAGRLRSSTPTGNATARPASTAAPAAGAAPAATRPVPAARAGISGLDLGLSIAAAVLGLGAVVSMVLLLQLK